LSVKGILVPEASWMSCTGGGGGGGAVSTPFRGVK
jgi:hypothetical protein